MSRQILNGITWGHSRGITPLLAGAQRFSELFNDVEIRWKKRSLQEFADAPLEELTKEYDLLIIDHPWSGCAAATQCVLPLDEYLPAGFLDDQAKNSVGGSHLSYYYGGHQWALAIDAATPATSYRGDLFEKNGLMVPGTWDELLEFAKTGRVLVPGIPVDTLMAFYMFCLANGQEPFLSQSRVIDMPPGLSALEDMKRLWSLCDKLIYSSNPITIAEIMSKTDDYWYCPFAYCYSNYSRKGYAKNVLTYRDLPLFGSYGRLRSTIGGTGIAISSTSHHKEIAIQFVQWITSGECQSTFYVENGGQPGHLSAWTGNNANLICNNFFSNLLPAMERGYIRPRYNGYLHFQDHAGEPLFLYLRNGGSAEQVLETMNSIYKESLNHVVHD
jgi:multiple sugar transport system substrate-binding protein